MANDPPFDLETRLRILLPETYDVFDDEVQPRSMGSAGLKYGLDGEVLWNEIWRSFCDLAMAGGPPHRGKLLEPSAPRAAGAEQDAYQCVSQEICRGVTLVTGLYAELSPRPGWLQMYCTSAAMRSWLMRAIVMENVSANGEGLKLYLPTGANFRIEKEVKNVITSVAKTCHYWRDHMSNPKHEEIAVLLATMDRETQLVLPPMEPTLELAQGATLAAAQQIQDAIGLQAAEHGYADWLGFECGEVGDAIWMMRALAVSNVLSRREETVVFFPRGVTESPAHGHMLLVLSRVRQLAKARHILG